MSDGIPLGFLLPEGVTVKSPSQVLVQRDRHPALSPTDMVSMKIENSDRIYNIEFKVLGG